MNRKWALIGGALLSLLAMYVIFILVISFGMRRDSNANRAAMEKQPFACPPDAELSWQSAGAGGLERFCAQEGQKEGPSELWEHSKLVLQGQYLNGKKHGTWIRYRDDGATRHLREYVAGHLVHGGVLLDDE